MLPGTREPGPRPIPPAPEAGPRTVAVVDIGASAIRLAVAQIHPDGAVRRLENLQRAVPLGKDAFSRGKLDRRTVNLAIEVLRGYQEIMRPYDVAALRAVATSAVRDSSNQELFVERVYMATGIAVEVISGAEEDRLIYAAVRDAFSGQGLDADADSLILEQGAGNLDIALLQGGSVVSAGSYPLGAVRLASSPGAERRKLGETLDLMKRFIGSAIDEIEHSFPLARTAHFVVVGSEARFAADRLAGEAGERRVRAVARDDFLRFARHVARMGPEQLARKYSLAPRDAETLGPALLTAAEVMKRTPAHRMLVPDVSMIDGVVLDLVAETTGRRLAELEEQICTSAENIGRRYQFDEAHARYVADQACILFDLLADEHGLGAGERRLLRVAGLLHEVGLFISSNSHHKHSEYIIGASDIFGLRPEERAIVACLARYHRRALPQPTHPGYAALSRRDRATVSKLASLLRVADALDRSLTQRIRVVSAELGPEELRLRVGGPDDLSLERMALRGKGDLFEEVFGRKVVLLGSATA